MGGFADKDKIMFNIHDLVYDSQHDTEFEAGWQAMLHRFSLHHDEWLGVMYNERHRWVPCYLKPYFWAGMSTTQRSESVNAFFGEYVHSKTSLKQFVDQYGRAMRKKIENEFQADGLSFTKMIPCVTSFAIEKQVQRVYTIAKFKEFRTQLLDQLYCYVIPMMDGKTYEVKENRVINGFDKSWTFIVEYDVSTSKGMCSCHLFEFRGILCRHFLMVALRYNVKVLPDCYILPRWRRDIKRAYTRVKINYDGWITTVEQERFDRLCTTFETLANTIADDPEKCKSVMMWLERQLELHKPAPPYHSSICGVLTPLPVPDSGVHAEVPQQIKDPKSAKRKGAPKKNRLKGPLEKGKSKSKPNTHKKRSTMDNARQEYAGQGFAGQPYTGEGYGGEGFTGQPYTGEGFVGEGYHGQYDYGAVNNSMTLQYQDSLDLNLTLF
ncbi:unnamed protein product [Cuscuta epithymum]|uniref:Protein FAR1-RELATED SEQUENCE n=1 Tax=Cuscuta epithymum TaxID=186058 RepID=A0AAV0FNQ4_9ASTE|nr:unnamed protein product [Cuscuta epithymum]